MSIEHKLLEKLRPHAKRISDGAENDFDFFPAVLLQVLEEQKQLGAATDAFSRATDRKWASYEAQISSLIGAIEKNADQTTGQLNGAQAKLAEKIQQLEDSTAKRLGHLQTALTTQFDKVEAGQNEKLLGLARAMANSAAVSKTEHAKTRKFLIAVAVAVVLGFGVCFTLLLRH